MWERRGTGLEGRGSAGLGGLGGTGLGFGGSGGVGGRKDAGAQGLVGGRARMRNDSVANHSAAGVFVTLNLEFC